MLYDGKSKIDRIGIFSTVLIRKGELIPISNRAFFDTKHGFNTSCRPNVSPRVGNSQDREALRDIHPGEEMTVNYRIMGQCNCGDCHAPDLRAYRVQPTCNCKH